MPLIVVGGVITVVIIAAIAAVALSGTGGGLAEPASVPIAVSGDPLPALPDSGADPAVGQAIPTLSGTNLDGEPITIGPDDGPMAVVIVAHWCPHCQAEVPRLVEYLESSGMPDGVELVALSTSINRAQPNYPPSAWLERERWPAPTMVDDANDSALAALGLGSFPGFVFVDDAGRVVQRLTGEIAIAQFDQIVTSLAP
jgi:cytochrome c biogenesis protein CcmG/thiol:disulfide interchange protein DsbE